MDRYSLNRFIWILVSAITLSACAGGGETGTGASNEPDIMTAVGPITRFGSIYVNGIEYETDGASVRIDGVDLDESHLKVGMIVTVTGTLDSDGRSGRANVVTFTDELEGIVTSNGVDPTSNSGELRVMGQQVNVSRETVFENSDINAVIPNVAAVPLGAVVEVSGFSDGMGIIHATRIELKAHQYMNGEEIEVKGIARDLSMDNKTFVLGQLTVHFDANAPTGNFSDRYVEVKSISPPDAHGHLIAAEVELEGSGDKQLHGEDGQEIELEGVVLVGENRQIWLNGQLVIIDQSTEFKHGATLDQLKTDTKIKLKAHFNTEGQLVAKEIEFKVSGENELEGRITAVNPDGTLVVNNQILIITSTTILRDDLNEKRNYNPAVNDWVSIHYYSRDNMLIATKLEREEGENEPKEGEAEAYGN